MLIHTTPKNLSTSFRAGTMSKHAFFFSPYKFFLAPRAPTGALAVNSSPQKPSFLQICQLNVLQGSVGQWEDLLPVLSNMLLDLLIEGYILNESCSVCVYYSMLWQMVVSPERQTAVDTHPAGLHLN